MMTGGIVVREASPEDAEGIARVHVASWQIAYDHIFPAEALARLDDTADRRAAFWRREVEAPVPLSSTLVAESEGEIVGFVDVRASRDDDAEPERTAELTAIYVDPRTWGVGAGRRLMEEALERLRASGFKEATLWVLEDNPRARRFYEIAGWRSDGGVKEDEFLDTRVREVRYRTSLGQAEARPPS
jgi:ribosomal protein S18 acetylase RimI-like enzyme